MPRLLAFCLILAATCAPASTPSAPPTTPPSSPTARTACRTNPTPPQEALEAMTVPPGFHVDLVAGEPDIVNPIAMTFDDRGRIWVTESVEYPRKPAGGARTASRSSRTRRRRAGRQSHGLRRGVQYPHRRRRRLRRRLGAQLPPTCCSCGRQRRQEVSRRGRRHRLRAHRLPRVAQFPHLGSRRLALRAQRRVQPEPDRRREARTTTSPARCGGSTRARGSSRSSPRAPATPMASPGTPRAAPSSRPATGPTTTCSTSSRPATTSGRPGAYPPFTMPIGSITDHGHQKTAYCGIVNLDSDAFPPQYRERICTGNIHGGCINVDRLARDGATYLAKAEPDLLTANDAWFMPVALKLGPDGCLYVLDWYDRYHCSQDAIRDPAGVDRLKGRLYRLRYGESPRVPAIDLATRERRPTGRAAGEPEHLLPRIRPAAADRANGGSPAARARAAGERRALCSERLDPARREERGCTALWALIGGGPLEPNVSRALLDHADAAFRAWAVRAAGNCRQGRAAPSAPRRRPGSRDPSPDVQLQVAIASRKIEGLRRACRSWSTCSPTAGRTSSFRPSRGRTCTRSSRRDGARFVRLLKSDAKPRHAAGRSRRCCPASSIGSLARGKPDAPRQLSRAVAEFTERHEPGLVPSCIAAVSAKVGSLDDSTLSELKRQLRPMLEAALDGKPRPAAAATRRPAPGGAPGNRIDRRGRGRDGPLPPTPSRRLRGCERWTR